MVMPFSDSLTNALQQALENAQNRGNTEVGENHLLAALLMEGDGYFSTIARAAKIDVETLLKACEKELEAMPVFTTKEKAPPQISRQLTEIINEAEVDAKRWKDEYLSSDHVFLSFWESQIIQPQNNSPLSM